MVSSEPENFQDESPNPKPRKIWKGILWGVLLLIGGLGTVMIYVNLHWKPFLKAQIQQAITTSTDSLYSVSFKDININIITGNVSLRKIVFKPDMRIYQKFMRQGAAPPHLYQVEVASLKLAVHPLRVYSKRALEIKSIEVDKPIIQMIYQRMAGVQDTLIMDERTAYQRLSPYLKSIKIEHIIFKDIDFKYIEHRATKNQITRLKNLNIEVTGLLIDSASQFDRSKLYFTKNIFVRLKNYELYTPNGRYHIKLKEFTASTAERYAQLHGLRVIPRYSENKFSEKFGEDQYAMRFDEIFLNNIDFKDFITTRRLNVAKLDISESNVEVFHHASPSSMVKKESVFPQIALQRFDVDTRIDTILIKNGRVSYTEYNPESQEKGTVFFNKIEGKLLNVSNELAAKQKNKFCEANFTTLLMGRGRLNVQFNFNLAAPDGAFTYKGNLGFMNLHVFNSLIRPLALVELRSGTVNKMNFTAKGNTQGVKGQMDVNYESLKINLLKKNIQGPWFKKLGLESMIANILILKKDNPSRGEALRKTAFSYHRTKHSSFFNMIWKGFLVGIKESVGLDIETQEMIAMKQKEFKAKQAEREQRRTVRLKKRQERHERHERKRDQ